MWARFTYIIIELNSFTAGEIPSQSNHIALKTCLIDYWRDEDEAFLQDNPVLSDTYSISQTVRRFNVGIINADFVRSQRPLHAQGDAGPPGEQGGGPKKDKQKKWRAEEEERHKGSLTPKKCRL
jgi:hypothetical protein